MLYICIYLLWRLLYWTDTACRMSIHGKSENHQYCTLSASKDASLCQQNFFYLFKVILLSSCLLMDLIVNATSEFENFEHYSREQTHKIHILLCSIQFLIQMSSFSIIFSLLCDTFPFQIGLIGVLIETFMPGFVFQFIYIILTLVTSGIRIVSIEIPYCNNCTW